MRNGAYLRRESTKLRLNAFPLVHFEPTVELNDGTKWPKSLTRVLIRTLRYLVLQLILLAVLGFAGLHICGHPVRFGVVVTLGGFAIVLSTVNFGAYLYQLATPRGAAEGFRLSRITVSIFAFFVGIVLIVAAFAWIPRNDDNKCTNNTGYATLPPLGLLPARALVETRRLRSSNGLGTDSRSG